MGSPEKKPDWIAEIKARADAASKGPWEVKTNRHPMTSGGQWGWIDGPCDNWTWSDRLPRSRRNAEFCAHAREDIPRLIAEVERLRAVREPDPEIGLMPCGCGGVATCYSTPNEIDMAFVACGGCDIRTPDMFPESAVESWNQAMMGWRGEE